MTTRIIKFAGLANNDGPTSDKQNGVDLRFFRHGGLKNFCKGKEIGDVKIAVDQGF